jgi:hypothetical protein
LWSWQHRLWFHWCSCVLEYVISVRNWCGNEINMSVAKYNTCLNETRVSPVRTFPCRIQLCVPGLWLSFGWKTSFGFDLCSLRHRVAECIWGDEKINCSPIWWPAAAIRSRDWIVLNDFVTHTHADGSLCPVNETKLM